MAKHTFKVGASAAEAVFDGAGGDFYDGDKPPVGIYNCVIRKMRLKENKNVDEMINILFVIDEKGDKSQYNGYAIWNNMNVTDQGAPFINSFLDGVGANKKVFWGEGGVILDDEDPPNILRIGTKRMDGVKVRLGTKDDKYNGETRLVPTRYLPVKEESDDGDDTSGADDGFAEDADADSAIALDAGDESADAAGDDDESEKYSKADLKAFTLKELKQLGDYWEFTYPDKVTKPQLEKLLWDYQENGTTPETEAAPVETEPAEESPAEDALTEAELDEMDDKELAETLAMFGGTMPKPPIRTRVIKAILKAQAETATDNTGEDDNTPPF